MARRGLQAGGGQRVREAGGQRRVPVGAGVPVGPCLPAVSPQAARQEVTICSYEAAPNPADHRLQQLTPQAPLIS